MLLNTQQPDRNILQNKHIHTSTYKKPTHTYKNKHYITHTHTQSYIKKPTYTKLLHIKKPNYTHNHILQKPKYIHTHCKTHTYTQTHIKNT